MFVYLTIYDLIQYTIQKNKKSIHNMIHDLTTILSPSLLFVAPIVSNKMEEQHFMLGCGDRSNQYESKPFS